MLNKFMYGLDWLVWKVPSQSGNYWKKDQEQEKCSKTKIIKCFWLCI